MFAINNISLLLKRKLFLLINLLIIFIKVKGQGSQYFDYLVVDFEKVNKLQNLMKLKIILKFPLINHLDKYYEYNEYHFYVQRYWSMPM